MRRIRLFAQIMKEIKSDTTLDECIDSVQVISSPEGENLSKDSRIPVIELGVNRLKTQHFLEDHDTVSGPFAFILLEAVKAGFALAQKVEKEQQK